MKRGEVVSVIGGSGFLGGYVVQELARLGLRINVVSRNPRRLTQAKTSANVGQIGAIKCDAKNIEELEPIIATSDYVVNLVGIMHERRGQTFAICHKEIASNIAQLCAKYKVKKLVHLSALSVDRCHASQYAKSKLAAEQEVRKYFSNSYILRPSVIFGPEDDFINMFLCLTKLMPLIGMVNSGKTKFQPVYVADVAKAVANIIALDYKNKIYELAGPQQYTLKEIITCVLKLTNRKRWLVNLSNRQATIVAFLIQYMPKPLLTRDQIKLLQIDSIINGENGLLKLGIKHPASMEAIIPRYLLK